MSRARIMIVEDERITAEDIHDILSQLGYTVTAVVSTGADAIREAERSQPDLVMMDIRIKGEMDGIEAAREIRERFGIPAIYLTAHADRETLDRAKHADPLGYLVKPFQEPELLASIEMALHKQKVDRRLQQAGEVVSGVLRAMDQAVIATDLDGMITLMNPAAESWTGWKLTRSRRMHVDQVVQLKGHNRISTYAERAVRKDALQEFAEGCDLVARDGSVQAIAGSVSPVRDHDDKLSGATIVFGCRKDDEKTSAATIRAIERAEPAGFHMIAESEVMQRLINFARRVATSEVSTILIRGESGTGKDVVARLVHYHSRRAEQPFLAINCAAIPETLLESELFG